MKMRMQQRDNETREGEGEEGTDEFTVLSLGNRFREMPMDHGLADLVLLMWVSNIRSMSLRKHDSRYSEERYTNNKEEETLTIMLMADCGWMDANTFYTTSSRTHAAT